MPLINQQNTLNIDPEKEALNIHGYSYESSTDSDGGKSVFDEQYYKYKPPPVEIDKSKIISIRSLTNVEAEWPEQSKDQHKEEKKKVLNKQPENKSEIMSQSYLHSELENEIDKSEIVPTRKLLNITNVLEEENFETNKLEQNSDKNSHNSLQPSTSRDSYLDNSSSPVTGNSTCTMKNSPGGHQSQRQSVTNEVVENLFYGSAIDNEANLLKRDNDECNCCIIL